MFSIGSAELVLILLVILFVVGPKKLPDVARMLGKFVRYFKHSLDELGDAIKNEPPEALKKEMEDFFNSQEKYSEQKEDKDSSH
jgi:Tat protein translocase TatB subunit